MPLTSRQLFTITFIVTFCLIFAGAVTAWTGPSAAAPGSNVYAPINVGSTAQVKTGGIWAGSLGSDGEIVSTLASGYGQLRMVAGNYGAFWRNDGANTYLLLTSAGNQYGIWNNLRPFYVNDATGAVTIANSLAVSSLTVNGAPVASSALAYGVHSQSDCWAIYGYVRGSSSGPLCVYGGTSCPAGWTRAASWGTTAPNSCGNGCSPCTTGSHAWANSAAETCTFVAGPACNQYGYVCTASVTQVGCY